MANSIISNLTSAAATTSQEIYVNSNAFDRKVTLGSVVSLTRTFADGEAIVDGSGNEQLVFQSTASAVNHIEVHNAPTGSYPIIQAAGDDDDIGLKFRVKGSASGNSFPDYETPTVDFYMGDFENNVFCIRQRTEANDGPYLVMFHDVPTGGVNGGSDVNDFIGAFEMVGRGNAANNPPTVYGACWTQAADVTDGAEDGRMIFYVAEAGAQYTRQLQLMGGVIIGGGSTVSLSHAPGNGNLGIGTGKGIFDLNSPANEMLMFFSATTSAKANYFTITATSAAVSPILGVDGSDTDVNLVLAPKGAGSVVTTRPVVTMVTSFAGLPTAGVVGRRAYCNDATTNGFHSTVAGGSTYSVPVYDDGTNWRVG